MAVRICTKSRNCFTCVDASVNDVTKVVREDPDGIFCCHQRYQGGEGASRICVKVSEIDTWTEQRDTEEDKRHFPLTLTAIGGINDENLQRDFTSVWEGVDYALEKNDVNLANDCIERIRVLAHSLSGTIGGPAAVAILDGLEGDGEAIGREGLRFPSWTNGRRCDTSTGGSRSCIAATNSKCHSDSTGCISTGTNFGINAGYVWGITLV